MIYLASQKGVNKAESEDAVLIGNKVICDTVGEYEIPQNGFICVADGVGGHNGGRAASHYVLNSYQSIRWSHQKYKEDTLYNQQNISILFEDQCGPYPTQT